MKMIVGLSGGVDSAVAAYLLKEAGHEVQGVFMKNWEDDDRDEYCTSREDFVSAAACAEVLGIELEHINFAQEYRERVFSYFLAELKAGRTPNPDILCNSEIKFSAFLENAQAHQADGIATGHYAQKMTHKQSQGLTHHLYTCADPQKDQTYFLYHLFPEQLAKAHFPLAHLSKTEVRALAKKVGIPSADRPDSTGICFIGERPFREFLARYLPKTPGEMIDDQGRVVGKHQGLAFYTLGQRKGLNIGGIKGSPELAWFVAKKDLINNRLMVVQGHQHPSLYQHEISAENPHWLAGDVEKAELSVGDRLWGRIRHRQEPSPCTLMHVHLNYVEVHFDSPQWAATPGQSLVLYRKTEDGLECLGGGVMFDRLVSIGS